MALLKHRADLAVHSLKDLPTDLPAGLKLGAVGKRADVRDVLIYRDADYLEDLKLKTQDSSLAEWTPGQSARRGFKPKLALKDLPPGAVVATSSTRRKAQLLAHHPRLKLVDIRGNIVTRLQKLMDNAELDATVLALAGLTPAQLPHHAGGQTRRRRGAGRAAGHDPGHGRHAAVRRPGCDRHRDAR